MNDCTDCKAWLIWVVAKLGVDAEMLDAVFTTALPVGNRYDRAALCQAEGRSLLGQGPTADQERQGEGMLRLAVTPAVLGYEVDDGWTVVRVWIGSLRWESETGAKGGAGGGGVQLLYGNVPQPASRM